MDLYFRESGESSNPPVVIMHGLLGSSRNWTAVAKVLAARFHVLCLDLRNHGNSPHHERMDYPDMVADLAAFFQKQGLAPAHLIGHSLGGKVAMACAMSHPELLRSLVVVDIAPRQYGLHFKEDINAMLSLDLSNLQTRKEADDALAEAVSGWAHRQFLLTNLQRDSSSSYYWAANIPVLAAHLSKLRQNPLQSGDYFEGPSLFLTGSQSDFVKPEDHAAILDFFPKSQLVHMETGHNVHAENPKAFLEVLNRFYAEV